MGLERVALRGPDDVLVVDVARARVAGWARHGRALEQPVVERRVLGAALAPAIEVTQLHAQDRGLERVEPRVRADNRVVVLGSGAVLAQQPHALGELRVLAHHRPAVPGRAETLAREEREASEVAHRAGATALPL